MNDHAMLIDNVGNAAGKPSASGAIRLTHDMIGVAQQWEGKAGSGGEGVIRFDRVKTGPENLHVTLREGIIEVTEPAPFGGSSPRIGFGIKPQDHLLATEIRQAHGGTIMCGDSKIRRLCPDCQHLRPPQEHAKPMFEQCEQWHTWPYDGLCRGGILSATSSSALARFTTGTSTTLPSSEVAPLPARSAASKAATTRLA